MDKTLGDRITKISKEKNLTQKKLAELIGVNETTISRYIKGTREPNASILKEMAKILNVSIDYLLGTSSDPRLSNKDEHDIAEEIKRITNDLSNADALMFDGDILDETTRELLISSLENAVYNTKILNNKERDKKRKL